jgi:hypothetical protein
VDAWRGQRFDRGAYEILVLSDGSGAPADLPEGGFRDQERFLCEPGANLSRLYDVGARAASGRFLVFTESHCVPERDFLAALDSHLQATGDVGACCRVLPVCDNALARMDHLLCEEGCSVFRGDGDWRKFNVQGVALERDTYLEVGGLRHRYDRYAEMLLAAALRDRGRRMGYAAAPTVHHRFRTGLLDVLKDVAAYVDGESAYRRDHPGPDAVGHTFLTTLPDDVYKTDLLAVLVSALGRDVISRDAWRRSHAALSAFVRAATRWLGAASAGWRAAGGTWMAMGRCHVWRWHPARLERAYRQMWTSATRWRQLRAMPAAPRALPPARWPASGSWRVDEWPEEHVLGLHAREELHGEPFRWTARTAVLRLPPGPGPREIVLETRGLRRDPGLGLRAYFQGRRLPGSAVRVEPEAVRLTVPESRPYEPGYLVLLCRPLRPWTRGVADARELGLPLFAVHVRRVQASRADERPIPAYPAPPARPALR